MTQHAESTAVGELSLGAGLVCDAALTGDLASRRLEGRRLGELIVDLGVLDQDELDVVLAVQKHLRSGSVEELANMVSTRLGAILVASGCVSQAHLDWALKQVSVSGARLGEFLAGSGALSAAQLNGALNFQKHLYARSSERFKLGRMLVESGDISETALQGAVERQQVSGKLLGETLLESGAIPALPLVAGLVRQRRFIAAAMAAVTFVVTSAGLPGDATAATTPLHVSARIPTHVSFQMVRSPVLVSITAADVAQGYVDLGAPIEVEVRTNSATGILLGMSLNSPAFTGATVTGPFGTRRITTGAPTLVIALPGRGMRTESLRLQLRIELAQDASPGLLAMPVSLFVSSA